MYALITHAIGMVGLALNIISYQIKSNKALFILQMFACVMFIIQFIRLDAISGSYQLIAVCIRNLIFLKLRDWAWVRKKTWIIIFIIISFGLTLYTWNGVLSLLPFAAVAVCTVGYWTDNARNIRIANLFVACPAWITYDIFFGAWAGVLNESITLASIIISIIRYGWKDMARKDSGF